MPFKVVNRYGKNWLGRTFKTQAKAKQALKNLRAKGYSISPQSKIVPTKKR